jgi:hypothetical protein
LADVWSRPQHVGAFVAALTMVFPDYADVIVHTALGRLLGATARGPPDRPGCDRLPARHQLPR